MNTVDNSRETRIANAANTRNLPLSVQATIAAAEKAADEKLALLEESYEDEIQELQKAARKSLTQKQALETRIEELQSRVKELEDSTRAAALLATSTGNEPQGKLADNIVIDNINNMLDEARKRVSSLEEQLQSEQTHNA